MELARSNVPGATLDVPAGIQAALEIGFDGAGLETRTLWAQVPHYLPVAPYPAATLALVEGLRETVGLRADPGDLAEEALATRNRLDRLVAEDPANQEMLGELERQHDAMTHDGASLPTSDELAAEVEQFLRDRDDDEPRPEPGDPGEDSGEDAT